jgi:hypothetical protein
MLKIVLGRRHQVKHGEKQGSPIYRIISIGIKINMQKAAYKIVSICKDVYLNGCNSDYKYHISNKQWIFMKPVNYQPPQIKQEKNHY